ncbi:2-oxo-4-hydroxy-4-carboxy-5-ureidoimidazoline decarboxylase [Providencia alcalifaciens]|nr:2-oxo-4-hydroxy-4-carboxy-5-ureidoimidazoline decarboxylase [Providencia alcalifaciens]
MQLIKLVSLLLSFLFCSNLALANQSYTIDELNKMTTADFKKSLSNIFEDTTWPIAFVAKQRPFTGFVNMYIDIINAVENSTPEKQLELIKSHPELACKNLRNANIAALSQGEQAGSGLNQCTAAEAQELARLNKEYVEKFGFPFLLAIKNASKEQIFTSIKARMSNSKQSEFQTALQQEYKIVLFRLLDQVK